MVWDFREGSMEPLEIIRKQSRISSIESISFFAGDAGRLDAAPPPGRKHSRNARSTALLLRLRSAADVAAGRAGSLYAEH